MPDASNLPDTDYSPRFRDFMETDIPRVVELGGWFFQESEFSEFSTFSPRRFERALYEVVHSPAFEGFVFEINGEIEGFLFYQLDVAYTEEPIALLWLFYVSPEYRRTPVGRELLSIAEHHALSRDAVCFYAGAMAGIPACDRTLKNMYRKAGYKDLFWGRKILREDADVQV